MDLRLRLTGHWFQQKAKELYWRALKAKSWVSRLLDFVSSCSVPEGMDASDNVVAKLYTDPRASNRW